MKARGISPPGVNSKNPRSKRGFLRFWGNVAYMLLAYIDEVGETGAFAGPEGKYSTSPAFGYAGFIIPATLAREFAAIFTHERNVLFKNELSEAPNPGVWEKKGADMFRPDTLKARPQHWRVMAHLISEVKKRDGYLFYYVDEKPLGTPKQTGMYSSKDFAEREAAAMRETLNRLARHANWKGEMMMVLMDQINEKARKQRTSEMYRHILGRATEHEEMRSLIEPPMHLDSVLSSNIQFADWVAAIVSRAVNYQLIFVSKYDWVSDEKVYERMRGSFTYESKMHYYQCSVKDVNHSGLFSRNRPLYPPIDGHLIGDARYSELLRKMKARAEKAKDRKN